MSLTKPQQQQLLKLAKDSIRHGLATGRPLTINLAKFPPELTAPHATFVTLLIEDELRGCIGVLEPIRPLAEDISENAFLAAFKDSRFPLLAADELDALTIHLSILSPAEPIFFSSEQDLLSQLRPGIDGLILEDGYRRATFLPSVWEQLPEPKKFLGHLKQKAGFDSGYWSENIKIYRYRTENIS